MENGMVSADAIGEPQDICDAIGCDLAEAEQIYNAAQRAISGGTH
jgi:hypothetical protein